MIVMFRKSVFENLGTGFSCLEILQEPLKYLDLRFSETF